jgi:aspartyl-tRNA(Asn)/glutamyl-tRNA(Gln) amidotransferase subunit A
MTADLVHLTAAELATKIHSREVSAVEVTRAHLDRIAQVNPELNLFLHVDDAGAVAAARAVDEALDAGRPRSRTCSPPPTCRPRAVPGSWRAGSRRTTRR